jgi:pSer/pThr/pTyr-binding forkhead associated (FHA) protein
MIIYRIGRHSDNDIVVDEEGVSTFHADFKYYEGNNLVIEDNNSSNGVWVNYRRVSKCLLDFEDVVHLGNVKLEFKKYFRFIDGHILETKEPNDYSENFLNLLKVEEEYEDNLLNINKASGFWMIIFRISIFFMLISSILFKILFGDDHMGYLLLSSSFFGSLSVLSFWKAGKHNQEKEQKRKLAREDFRLSYVCPSCGSHIPDSTYAMKKKKHYACRQCKALIYNQMIEVKNIN